MKRKIALTFTCLVCALLFINSGTLLLPLCDAPLVGGHTGAPGETACNGCHPGTLNSGTATFTFDLGTTTYSPSQTYTGTVRINQAGMPKFGFAGLALKDSNNTTIGVFTLIDAVRTRTYVDGPRKYVSHTPCGADSANANSWKFKWTAPPTNVGNITLYIGMLAANHSHSTAGDFSYTNSKLLTFQSSVDVNEEKSKFSVDIYPSPARENLNIQIKRESDFGPFKIYVYDINGKIIYFESSVEASVQISTFGWSKGIYHVKLQQNNRVINKKIAVN